MAARVAVASQAPASRSSPGCGVIMATMALSGATGLLRAGASPWRKRGSRWRSAPCCREDQGPLLPVALESRARLRWPALGI